MEVKLKLDTGKLMRAFHRVPEHLGPAVDDALDHSSKKFLKEFKRRRLQGPPGIKGRPRGIFSKFHRRFISYGGITDKSVTIYTDSKVARLHEEGGTVKDPSGGRIAVPLSARTQMFTSGGKLRKAYKDVRNLKNVTRMTFNNKPFLVRVKKRGKELLPLFVLKHSIKIRPRLGYYRTFEEISPMISQIMNRAFDKALDKGWGKA